jgi:hypothetical protein
MFACLTISAEGGKTRLSVRTDSMVDDMVGGLLGRAVGSEREKFESTATDARRPLVLRRVCVSANTRPASGAKRPDGRLEGSPRQR